MDINSKNISNLLLESIPEYIDSDYYKLADRNNVSSVFGNFGNFLLEIINICSEPEKDFVVQKSFDFLNNLICLDNQEILNVVVVEIFEVLAGTKKAIVVAEKMLNDKGLYWLNNIKDSFISE